MDREQETFVRWKSNVTLFVALHSPVGGKASLLRFMLDELWYARFCASDGVADKGVDPHGSDAKQGVLN